MNLNQIRCLLRDRRIDIVSDGAGLHPHVVSRVRDGTVQNPNYKTVDKLRRYFEKREMEFEQNAD